MKALNRLASFVLVLTVALAVAGCSGITWRPAEPVQQEAIVRAPSSSGILGANNPHIWFDSQAYTALDAIKSNGFNTVRIVWQTNGSGSRLKQIIDRCKALGLKPIPELHDVTGSTNSSDLDRMVTWWIDNKSYIAGDVWINIANEWGPRDSTVWRDAYRNAIQRMRSNGISNTIVIDSGGWGQDDQDIRKYAKELLGVDSNLMFSIHMYGEWNDNNKINDFLTYCKNNGLPIMVGEFGYNYNDGNNNLSCKVDAAYLIQRCKELGIGYIGWSWCGNNSENAWLDMTNDWKTLNYWGNLVRYGSTTTTPSPSPRPTPTPTSPVSGGYVVNYAIANDWGTGATVNVTIKNNTSSAVNGWTLTWTFHGNQQITTLWNGTYTQSGASVSVKNASWNAFIPANGGTVNFGFNLSYSGTNAEPVDFKLNGTPCAVQ
ncbi:MAG: cellulase family glycosylhydrolase [Firmicutes bacterium]|nr:cellulase family glycosylhydrolase [Bacillota bacterium]